MASFIETVLRSRDLLHVQFEFVNLKLDSADPVNPALVGAGPGPAFIVMRLPPQHVTEEAFDAAAPRRPPYDAVLACPSRLAFEIPAARLPIAFTIDGLLRTIASMPPLIAESPGNGPGTFIEFPDRVLLVPQTDARLFHRSDLLSSDNDGASAAAWTDLWQTRMAAGNGTGGVRFRAVANPVDTGERLANGTLMLRHRQEIVARCRNPPAALVGASRFLMTALGATARMKSEWPPSASNVLSAWEHQATAGRDRVVRIVEQGFLYPFGHRASRQTITQRDFSTLSGSTLIAGLEKHVSIIVEDADRDYGALRAAYEHDGREMPLKRVRIVSSPAVIPSGNTPVTCGVQMTDAAGHLSVCDLTMFFVTHAEVTTPGGLTAVQTLYRNANTAVLRGQAITLADDDNGRGDTTFTVTGLAFRVTAPRPGASIFPPFLPALETAEASLPSVDQLLASTARPGGAAIAAIAPSPARTLKLHDSYLGGFLPGDVKQVFATFDPPMPAISIPAERAGAIAAPTFAAMDGLSRVRGPVAGVQDFASDRPIDPLKLIAGQARLLGAIELRTIVDSAVDHLAADHPEQLFERIEDPGVFATRPVLTRVKTPSGIEVRFIWKPRIKATGLPAPLVASGGPVTLIAKGRIRTGLDAAPDAAFEVDGRLSHFGLAFARLLTVHFDHVTFKSGGGAKMDVKVAIRSVEFGDDLKFIQKISDLLSKNGLGGARIQPQADGVVVGFSLRLPSFGLGVMSFQDIAVISSLSLPFVNKPAAVRFSLSERSHPFLVSVSIFGGTGYFGLEVRTDGSVQIEAGIEFGGIVSINLLGIVSGGVYVFAGVFVSVDSHGVVVISGHLRFGGYVDVAGLITISIEFYIALTYNSHDKVLVGLGRVTVGVRLLFFSLSRTFEVQRRIAGFGEPPAESVLPTDSRRVAGPAPPSFTTTMSTVQWEQYCKAFG